MARPGLTGQRFDVSEQGSADQMQNADLKQGEPRMPGKLLVLDATDVPDALSGYDVIRMTSEDLESANWPADLDAIVLASPASAPLLALRRTRHTRLLPIVALDCNLARYPLCDGELDAGFPSRLAEHARRREALALPPDAEGEDLVISYLWQLSDRQTASPRDRRLASPDLPLPPC